MFQKCEMEADFEAKLDSIKVMPEIFSCSTTKASMQFIKNGSNTASSNSSMYLGANKLQNIEEEHSERSEEIKLPKKSEVGKAGKTNYSLSSDEKSVENFINTENLNLLSKDELMVIIAKQKLMIESSKNKSNLSSF